MSVAFLTLIVGFLLGKFTSDRNQMIKENFKRQHDVTHKPQMIISEVDKLINSVIETARDKLTTESSNLKEQYLQEDGPKKITEMLRHNFTTCLGEFSVDNEEDDLEDFLRHILRNSYDLYLDCTRELRKILET